MTISIEQLYDIYLKFPRVGTDSRQVEPGSIFFGLVGERFDGQKYAADALEKGAAFAVVQDADLAKTDKRFLLVPDTLKALQDLARHHRRQLIYPVVALTGSNGKTTTKELMASVLSARYRTLATPGNYNNHIGLPLTLLQATHEHEILVLEMGANHQGEIDALCRIAEPSHGLITNIGKAHLEGFGGIEGVKKGKSEIYRYLLETNGVAFVNQDEQFLTELSAGLKGRILYGRNLPGPLFTARLEEEVPFLKVRFGEGNTLIETNLTGAYNFPNILTAIAVGQYFKVPETGIAAAIAAYLPENNRSQWKDFGDHRILLDAYNANPTSILHALKAFDRLPEPKKWVVLGDMLELGEDSTKEHAAILELARSLNFEQVITMGPEFGQVVQSGDLHFPDLEAMRAWWDLQDRTGALILLKASRGIGLERLLK